MLSKQRFGKSPFSISLMAACISGKQTSAASLKSLSWLSSFLLAKVIKVQCVRYTRKMERAKTIKTDIALFTNSMRLRVKVVHIVKPL